MTETAALAAAERALAAADWPQAEALLRAAGIGAEGAAPPRGRALLGLVRALLGQRRLGDADALLTLAAPSGSAAADSYFLTARASLHLLRGAVDAAWTDADAAIAAGPDLPQTRLLRAQLLLRRDAVAQADAELRIALQLDPDLAAGWAVRGLLARRAGRLDEAETAHRRAVALAPGHAELHGSLAMLLGDRGKLAEAEAHLRQALALRPTLAEAHNNLGVLLKKSGRTAEAMAAMRAAIAQQPDSAEAQGNLGGLLHEVRDYDAALPHLRRAIALRPTSGAAHYRLGLCLAEAGDRPAALEALDRALALDPEDERTHWVRTIAELPLVADSTAELAEGRTNYAAGLAALAQRYRERPDRLGDGAAGIAALLPFYLPYQAGDDRALQAGYGQLAAGAMAAQLRSRPQPRPQPPAAPDDGRIRLGIVSAYFRSHSVWKIITSGWLAQLDRSRFAITGYRTVHNADGETDRARGLLDGRLVGPFAEPLQLADRIAADRPHVLLYPEIGMDQTSFALAALRLAPLQMVSWGHPVTTGLPTMDLFLSSAAMEPADGDRHYTEKLVRLPGLSISYAPLPPASGAPASGPLDRGRLGVGADDVLYLCCQSLFKYRPCHDALLPAIARQLPNARFLFLSLPAERLTRRFQARMAAAFVAAGLDPDRHLRLLPHLTPADYAALNRTADIYLDSIDWSGGNTTLEALAEGLPVITLPGRLMRGRHSMAILETLGLTDTIARDADDYVALAVRLGRDPEWRAALRAAIGQRLPRLYNDPAPVRALEQVMREELAARGVTTGRD